MELHALIWNVVMFKSCFEYDFQDFTYGGSDTEVIPIKYRVEGSMTLQRNINTQIPDEDQQIEW